MVSAKSLRALKTYIDSSDTTNTGIDTSLRSNLTTLSGRVTTVVLGTLSGRVTTVVGAVTNLSGRVTNTILGTLSGRVTTLSNKVGIAALTSHVGGHTFVSSTAYIAVYASGVLKKLTLSGLRAFLHS